MIIHLIKQYKENIVIFDFWLPGGGGGGSKKGLIHVLLSKGSAQVIYLTETQVHDRIQLKVVQQSGRINVLLAHLSRRLIGELIVYEGIRRQSVRPSVRRPSVCQHFQTTSPLKP